MNAFFDGYVHPKISLKQFVEQYEQVLRNKVENEFQADFKSLSNATVWDNVRNGKVISRIVHNFEVQVEFTGKVYYEGEDIVYAERRGRIFFDVLFNRENYEIICSCHMFDFRGIVCRHAIAVLIRNEVTVMSDRYILRIWMRDVSRAHTRVDVNYAGMVSTPGQLRYDEMCQAFATVADVAADGEGRHRVIMDWIQLQNKELRLTKSSFGSSNNLQCVASQTQSKGTVRDPISSKTKGAPKTKTEKRPIGGER